MKKNSLPYKSTVLAAITAASLLFTGDQIATVQAADHRDAPSIDEDPRADLLDVYAFTNPNDTNKVVLVMTVNPFEEGGAPGVWFSKDVLYQFKIDNTGDYKEDLVIQAIFTEGVPGPQTVTIIGPSKATSKGTISTIVKAKKNVDDRFSGLANQTVISNSNNTIRAFAGLRDDPFFFDLVYVFRLLGLSPGGPLTRSPGINFFAGFNCSALVVEVPSSLLKGPAAQGNAINIWATTSRGSVTSRSIGIGKADKSSTRYVQIERMGKPALNTVLIKGARKDDFNRGIPTTDRANFRAEALAVLVAVNGDADYSNTIIDVLFPDVLTLDMGNLGGYLNGRRLQDDVIDITLNVASHGAVTSDGVSGNDVPFLTAFPFLAPPHAATEAVPARN